MAALEVPGTAAAEVLIQVMVTVTDMDMDTETDIPVALVVQAAGVVAAGEVAINR